MKILSEVEVCYWLVEWCKEAGVDPKQVSFRIVHKESVVRIYTSRPGLLIGYRGSCIDKYQQKFKEMLTQRKIEKEYFLELVEVTLADFWVHYDYME